MCTKHLCDLLSKKVLEEDSDQMLLGYWSLFGSSVPPQSFSLQQLVGSQAQGCSTQLISPGCDLWSSSSTLSLFQGQQG